MNCLSWNMFWDFGAGQIGDMGSHTMDLLWNAVDATCRPRWSPRARVQPRRHAGRVPVALRASGQRLARPIRISWYQGGAMPPSPKRTSISRRSITGRCSRARRASSSPTSNAYPAALGDKGRPDLLQAADGGQLLPPLGDFQKQWIDACKNGGKTACDFEYSCNMIEQMLLGLVAYRVGKKIHYDGAAGRVTDCPEANALLRRKYRQGWKLDG